MILIDRSYIVLLAILQRNYKTKNIALSLEYRAAFLAVYVSELHKDRKI